MKDVDIVVAGGGHAGLLAANWLQNLDFSLLVIDPYLRDGAPSARCLAMLGGAQMLLAQAGLWRALEPFSTKVSHVDVADLESGGHCHYRAEDIGADSLAFGFRQSDLRNALLKSVESSCLCEDRVESLQLKNGRIEVSSSNGTIARAKLAIGADGRMSRLRKLAGFAVSTTDYGQVALNFTATHDRDHRHTVIERMSAEGPLAVLPIGDKECGLTWVRSPERARASEAEILSDAQALVSAKLGELRLSSAIDRYPLGALHAAQYVAPRLALIGDAAHGVHPIHAQGFNMGVADVAALAQTLTGARARGEDIGGACLRRYQTARMPDNHSRLRMTDGLNRLFSNGIGPLMPVRRAVLNSLSAFAPLRQKAIRHGMRL